ncbi:hypothetical protein GUJ93_ZPchr0005g16122 [Zizania palustris]|uniref:Uncharacterized protein n=1 Tax=Zizania palustris TaxID=103762 RepID=A0A8J5T679_ZIZPA|nr:hypothetical protein GUJ93_ZPchr0005g16122 [Zizania palustris]
MTFLVFHKITVTWMQLTLLNMGCQANPWECIESLMNLRYINELTMTIIGKEGIKCSPFTSSLVHDLFLCAYTWSYISRHLLGQLKTILISLISW